MKSAVQASVCSPRELRGVQNLASEFGVKGAELCVFAWKCAELGYPFPQSWLLRAANVDLALGEARSSEMAYAELFRPGRHTVLDYGALPAPESTLGDLVSDHKICVRRLERVVATLPPLRRALLRSSVIWPAQAQRPPGVDVTVPSEDPNRAGRLYGGVHKAYAHLCHRRWSVEIVRFALILSALVPVKFEGTAYITPTGIAIEFGAAGVQSVIATTPTELATSGMLGKRRATELFAHLAVLAGDATPGATVELEFLLDHGEQFVPVQRRVMPAATTARLAPFQSLSSFAGPATDLRGAHRDRRILRRALASSPESAFVLPVHQHHHLDVFALLWALDREPGLRHPRAVIVTRDERSHAGMPTHVRWLAAAMLPDTSIYYMPNQQVPCGDGRLRIVSDGVRAWCRRSLA